VANPFATLDPELNGIVANAYQQLASLSRRSDVTALYDAAQQANKLS
jgi:hypothetical protein